MEKELFSNCCILKMEIIPNKIKQNKINKTK